MIFNTFHVYSIQFRDWYILLKTKVRMSKFFYDKSIKPNTSYEWRSTYFWYVSLCWLARTISSNNFRNESVVTGIFSRPWPSIPILFVMIVSMRAKSLGVHLHCDIFMMSEGSGTKFLEQISLHAMWKEATEMQAMCFCWTFGHRTQ